jgi:hypothetical protein
VRDCGNHDQHSQQYCDAYAILSAHAERIGLAEGQAQLSAHLAKGRKRSSFGTGRRYPFVPSSTLLTIVSMMTDPEMTPERALAFLHDPSVHAWDAEQRMRNTG